ncbi:MAG: hypothetical protein EZS28_047746, partial [Streblomastix strix]
MKGDWATVIDIHNAFNYIKVNRELRGYLAFGYKKKSYAYLVMPLGPKAAPYIFHQYLLSSITQVRYIGIRITIKSQEITIQEIIYIGQMSNFKNLTV